MSEGASERTSEKTSEWFHSNSLVLSLTHSFSHNLSLDTSFVFSLFSRLLTPISRVRKITGKKTNEAIREKCKKTGEQEKWHENEWMSKRENNEKTSEWVNEKDNGQEKKRDSERKIARKRLSEWTRKMSRNWVSGREREKEREGKRTDF